MNHNRWLWQKIRRQYGRRCDEYKSECWCCRAWEFYDEVKEKKE